VTKLLAVTPMLRTKDLNAAIAFSTEVLDFRCDDVGALWERVRGLLQFGQDLRAVRTREA
jgi:catechol 2,3-dioxygenase-like lactoylglutathione lyase family enzyme